MTQQKKIGSLSTMVHMRLAHRVYTAISTLLYATISMSKVPSLEKFIRKKASTLPVAIYNGNEWATILQIANNIVCETFMMSSASQHHVRVVMHLKHCITPSGSKQIDGLVQEIARIKREKENWHALVG